MSYKKNSLERKKRLRKRNEKVLSVDIDAQLYDKLNEIKNHTHIGKRFLVVEALQMLVEKYKDKLND